MSRRFFSMVAVLLAVAAAAPAEADGVLPAAATPVQREQAQSRFLRGKELFGKRDFEQALSEFRASHEIVASPNTRLQIARCLRVAGRIVAAYAELGRTIVEAKELAAEDNRYQRASDAAIAERSELEPKLGFVTLNIQNPTDDTRVKVGEEEIRRAAWSEPAPVLAGTTQVTVETPGHSAVTRSVTLAAGERTSLTIDAQSGESEGGPPPQPAPPAPAPSRERPSDRSSLRTWAYVAGGVGGAGLVTFAVFGSLARSTYNDLQTVCGGSACPPSKANEISAGRTQQTVANVGLTVGVLGAATGATLFVLSWPKSAAAPSTALVVSPGWIGMRGSL